MSNFFEAHKAAMTSNKDDWETPQALFDELDAIYHFTLDPCSTHENAKCKKHYTSKEDGLKQSWDGETVFCNPPYGRNIGAWVKKCHDESKHATIVMLIPARTDTAYFHDYIYRKARIEFIRGRLKFERGGQVAHPLRFRRCWFITNRRWTMTPRTRNFKCPTCRESFHIKRLNSHWVRFMPPKFFPMCGERVDDATRKEHKQ